MFRKCFLPILLFLSSVHFSSGLLYAQEEEGEIIAISERVGNEIDQEERDKYKLFKEIEGFQSAVCLKLPDNSYVLKVTYHDENTGELKIKYSQQSEQSMNSIRYRIDQFEEKPAREQPILKTDVYQEPGTAFFLELGGKQFLSLNVDFRINKSNRFSFGIGPLPCDPWEACKGSSYIIPCFIYYRLLGEEYSKFEVGGGFSVFHIGSEDITVVMFHGVLGYRYQKKNGLLFRIGFTPLVLFPEMFIPMFGISFGYSR